jgi:hypothetical protein
MESSTPDKLVFNTSFHHMDENGYYTGWTDHNIIVTPTFGSFKIAITGKDRGGIKEYLHDVFDQVFTVAPEGETTGSVENEDMDPTVRYYNADGIIQLLSFKPDIQDNELKNASDLFEAVEHYTGAEGIPGDIVTVIYTNKGATRATVFAYIINENFMGSYDVTFYGKRSHNF